MSTEYTEIYAPRNFTWVSSPKIAGLACPENKANMRFLLVKGINHLVTLSAEYLPPAAEFPEMKWTVIPVKEFRAPTLEQIIEFINICKNAEINGEVIGVHCRKGVGRTGAMLACYLVHFQHLEPRMAIRTLRKHRPRSCESSEQEDVVSIYHDYFKVLGVHCRQGRGQTGTMLACYLVHFKHLAPERAVLTIRVQRPGSCETYEQENVVCRYHDCLRGTLKVDYRLVDNKKAFDEVYPREDETTVSQGTQDTLSQIPDLETETCDYSNMSSL